MKEHAIVWFRQDLRIADNPALAAAAKCGLPVIALFIHAPDEERPWEPGAASNWWLYHALSELDEELEKLGLQLTVRQGASLDTLLSLIGDHAVRHVFWNRRYEPAVIERDTRIKQQLRKRGLEVHTFNSALLYEPHEIANRSGEPFRVFTPFWKHLYGRPRRPPVEVRTASLQPASPNPDSLDLEELGLMPGISWDSEFYEHWKPGLEDATEALETFVGEHVRRYKRDRDFPGVAGTSRLSPYLHFGQLGPRQVWQAVEDAGARESDGGFTFLSEIAWREFAYHLLYHFPQTPGQALNEKFREFPWEPDPAHLEAWQKGMTGYPVVDAGMRQLWRTGWMHNRVRMIVASFLVKHQLQPWQDGARWFWDTLVDADLASNTMGWQWTAGCGADAAPYFRIFNPILQGEKFDPKGSFVRAYVPELKQLPDRLIHQPWEATDSELQRAGVRLGRDYPRPVIDHKVGRERALAALSANKQKDMAADGMAGGGA
jgi:deoxyribodipyrimidine photo-lyase